MAQVGSLYSSLTLESSSFVSNMRKASREAQQGGNLIERALGGVQKAAGAFAVVGAAAAGMAAALAVPISRAISNMDNLAKAAQKVGTSVEDLSRLRFGAEMSGLNNSQLETGLTRLNVALAGIGPNATGASRALASLGVTAGTSTLDAMKKVADEFQRMPDGARKSALAVEIFGRSGAQLIPLLNQGASGIESMAKEADRLGIVIDTRTARAAEQFSDNLTRLGRLKDGLITQITAGLVPAFAALTDEIVRGLTAGQSWQEVGRQIGLGLLKIAEGATVAYEAIAGVVNALGAFGRASAQAFGGDFRGAIETIQLQEFRTQEAIARRRTAFLRARFNAQNFRADESPRPPAFDPDAFEAALARSRGRAGRASAGTGTQPRALSDAEIRLQNVAGPGILQGVQRTFSEIDRLAKTTVESLADIDSLSRQLDASRFANAMEDAAAFADRLSGNLAQAIIYGQNFGTAVVNSLKAIAAEMLASGLRDLLLGAGGQGGILGGLIGSIFGGRRAMGGPVQPGKAYVVGERGPELFMPSAAGTIIPSGKSASGGGGTVINMDLRGAGDPGAVQQAAMRAFELSAAYTDGRFQQAARPRLPRGLGA
jgi:hypothetical protein